MTAGKMQIRRYRCGDRGAVWRLHNLALRQVDAHPGSGQWDRDLHRIEAEYLAAGGEFLVGVIGERVVAVGALKRHTDRCAEITRMRVHPDVQRRGLGTRLLVAPERCARQRGVTRLLVETTPEQVAALRLYTGSGYRETGRRRHGRFEVVALEKDARSLPGIRRRLAIPPAPAERDGQKVEDDLEYFQQQHGRSAVRARGQRWRARKS